MEQNTTPEETVQTPEIEKKNVRVVHIAQFVIATVLAIVVVVYAQSLFNKYQKAEEVMIDETEVETEDADDIPLTKEERIEIMESLVNEPLVDEEGNVIIEPEMGSEDRAEIIEDMSEDADNTESTTAEERTAILEHLEE